MGRCSLNVPRTTGTPPCLAQTLAPPDVSHVSKETTIPRLSSSPNKVSLNNNSLCVFPLVLLYVHSGCIVWGQLFRAFTLSPARLIVEGDALLGHGNMIKSNEYKQYLLSCSFRPSENIG